MSFFGKFKPGSTPSAAANAAQAKKESNTLQPTPLEKHLVDATGPVRQDGSDKFFGFENYGSTWYVHNTLSSLTRARAWKRQELMTVNLLQLL